MTVVGTWTGQQAADLRAALRMPITEFAARLGIAERTVSNWERMLTAIVPAPWMQEVLDVTLERATDAVKDRFALLCAQRTVPAGPPGGDDDVAMDLNRRELLRLLAITGSAIGAGTVEAIDEERLSDPRADTSAALLDEYQKVSSRLWRVYAQASPKRAVAPLVNTHLTLITARLRNASEPVRARLCALASDAFQLAGEVCFDANHYTDAAHCYTLAADAARASGAADLWACAMTRHSFIYVYSRYGQDFRAAVPMLEAATGIALRGDRSLSTWQWASCVQAQALAGLGDFTGCQRSLADAETVSGLSGAAQNGGWLRFDGSRLPEERGSCYAALGRPDLAVRFLGEALQEGLSGRRLGSVHTDLAAAGLLRGDLDEFASHADAALQLAAETSSGYLARRLRGLVQRTSEDARDPRVSEVTERINALEVHQ